MAHAREDPFNIAQESLLKDLRNIKTQLYGVESEPSSRSSEALAALKKDVEQFKANLRLLNQAINVSRKNLAAFGLSDDDIITRTKFAFDCEHDINRIQQRVQSLSLIDPQQVSLLKNVSEQRQIDTQFARNELQHQLGTEIEQDRRLQDIARVAGQLTETAQAINQELNEQTILLDEFDLEVEEQHGAVNQVVARMGKVLKTNNRRQIKQVLYLLAIFFVLLALLLL